jgi:hypothetical protein
MEGVSIIFERPKYVVARENEGFVLICVFQEFVAYPNVAGVLKEFCAEKETNVTVLMGLHIDCDKIQRDIAVFSSAKPRIAQEVCFFLITHILCILYKECREICP